MELDPVFLSRLQFAFVVSFHIIFPASTIGLASWLATIDAMRFKSSNPVRGLPTRSVSWSGGARDG